MGINIASLFATIGVNTDPLNKGLGGAKQSLTQFGGEMAKQVIGTLSLTTAIYKPVSYTHLTLPTIYSV